MPPGTKRARTCPASISSTSPAQGYSPRRRGQLRTTGGPGLGDAVGMLPGLDPIEAIHEAGIEPGPPWPLEGAGDDLQRPEQPLGHVRRGRHRRPGSTQGDQAPLAPDYGEKVLDLLRLETRRRHHSLEIEGRDRRAQGFQSFAMRLEIVPIRAVDQELAHEMGQQVGIRAPAGSRDDAWPHARSPSDAGRRPRPLPASPSHADTRPDS